jgi:protein Tex
VPTAHGPEEAKLLLRDMIARHSVRAIAIGGNASNRSLETMLRQILADEKIENVLVASVNDAGVAIYASSRIAREELPEQSVSARCAASMARRLQDPLAELVKIDPKLIGVGQYQHDVDQKELHRSLVQIVRACVNSVGADPNTASHSLLRYVSGFNDKLARKLIATRNSNGPFASRAALMTIPGMDEAVYLQSAGFLRIKGGENPLDRTAVHPEAYSVVDKIAANLNVPVADLVGNKEQVANLRFEDYVTDEWGPMTLHDIREELLRPGRDPRRSFTMPKFRADVREIGDLKEGMELEGTVTNVTNFGAFIDIGVRQDGLVHLSQMSNRFIRDPREAVKVGDVVRVKVISVEPETKRIGLSMKALLPAIPKKKKKVLRRPGRPGEQGARGPGQAKAPGAEGGDQSAAPVEAGAPVRRPQDRRNPLHRRGPKPNRPHRQEGGDRPSRPAGEGSQLVIESAASAPDPAPDMPQQTLQEKIAILQSKFRGIK